MQNKSVRLILVVLLFLELLSGIEWGVHRGGASLFAQDVLQIISYTQIGYIVSLFGLSKAITNLLFGVISDKAGRKPVIVIGIILTGLGGAIIGVSTSFFYMLLGTILVGVGGGATFVGIMVSLTEVLPLQIGLAMGLFELAAYGGSSVGTYIGGILSLTYGMRFPFYLFAVLSGVASVICLTLLPETQINTNSFYKSNRSIISKNVLDEFVNILPLCLAGFSSKILDSLIISFLPLYLLSAQLGLDKISIILSSFTLSWALLQPISGHVSDRVGRKGIITIGLAGSSFIILLFTSTLNYAFLVFLALILGVGAALYYTPIVAMVSDIASQEIEGTIIGVYRFFRDMGYFFGPIVLGKIGDVYGLEYSFYFTSAVLMGACVVLVLRVKETN